MPMRRIHLPLTSTLLVAALVVLGPVPVSRVSAADVPDRLTDAEFWALSQDLSEPDGSFRSENLLSNEMVLPQLLPEVLAKARRGGVYIGVGPEQNFSYLVALQPRMAFITDVRRGNLHVILMYKALFELSADRAEFVARLFTRGRGAGLSTSSTVQQIMDASWAAAAGSSADFARNLREIQDYLTTTRRLPLSAADREGIARTYAAFHFYGPAMDYSATTGQTQGGFRRGNSATYRDLMTQTDANGRALSYLASEASFHHIKDLFSRNVIVPVVGNFSGPKAIRGIGDWVRARGATVNVFYVSTVEHYLRDSGTLPVFCANVASLPLTPDSVFIRPGNVQQLREGNAMGRGGGPASLPVARTSLGQYQIGVVVPIAGGCG
jgi:hypothetical protein